jgi:hypothetical protein
VKSRLSIDDYDLIVIEPNAVQLVTFNCCITPDSGNVKLVIHELLAFNVNSFLHALKSRSSALVVVSEAVTSANYAFVKSICLNEFSPLYEYTERLTALVLSKRF